MVAPLSVVIGEAMTCMMGGGHAGPRKRACLVRARATAEPAADPKRMARMLRGDMLEAIEHGRA